MQCLYLIRVTGNQATGKQIDIQKKIAMSFFGISEQDISEGKNIVIHICHAKDKTKFEDIEIQTATNVRFSTKLNSFLASNGDAINDSDILVIENIGRSYCVRVIHQEDSKYAPLKDLFEEDERHMLLTASLNYPQDTATLTSSYIPYITALKTKPFLLLAGISGTGKSRLVKELAFMTCPKGEPFRSDETTPYNYCLIEVKPNWHDSSELLGYYNALDSRYELTPFIRFVYRASQYLDVPFFVCLDEMNLAPVEQYFAEYLSVLETRTVANGEIVSAALLKKDIFEGINADKYTTPNDKEILLSLQSCGLHLPANLYIVGTVNMDDTTHQFSRKVIDRAFTIEMNGGKLTEMFTAANADALTYRDSVLPFETLRSYFVSANEVLAHPQMEEYANAIKTEIPTYLEAINVILKDTPFQVSYRVQNELILYLANLIQQAGFPKDITPLIGTATLAVLLQKILPRIQGDDKLLGKTNGNDIFTELEDYIKLHFLQVDTPQDEESSVTKIVSALPLYTQVVDKLDQMHTRLTNSYFANFF